METDIQELFSTMRSYDPTLRISRGMLKELKARQIFQRSYSRESLFSGMANGEVRLFHDYPMPFRSHHADPKNQLQKNIRNLTRSHKLRVRCGPKGNGKYITSKELVDRWDRERGMTCITDLHIRDTKVESVIDTARLSWFNLLPKCEEDAAMQEMMTMVLSSKGSVSDSHSDAPDGSNCCFEGQKVWLMWDTFEGLNLGLDDTARCDISTACSFDMKRFLRMKSARWLMISSGETLFLPGDLSHKVITLKKYIGVGSFYVSLPNCLRTLSRWTLHDPIWALNSPEGYVNSEVSEIARVATKTIRTMKSRSNRFKIKMGQDYLRKSLNAWDQSTNAKQKSIVSKMDYFREYVLALSDECGVRVKI